MWMRLSHVSSNNSLRHTVAALSDWTWQIIQANQIPNSHTFSKLEFQKLQREIFSLVKERTKRILEREVNGIRLREHQINLRRVGRGGAFLWRLSISIRSRVLPSWLSFLMPHLRHTNPLLHAPRARVSLRSLRTSSRRCHLQSRRRLSLRHLRLRHPLR